MKDQKQKNKLRNQHQILTQSQQIKQFWTQHCRTLIAYEMKYVRNRKPQQQQQSPPKPSNKKKKLNLYESGFLIIDQNDSKSQIQIPSLVHPYQHLSRLFQNQSNPPDLLQLKKLVQIMLELKHQLIIRQFCLIYQIIVREIWKIGIQQVRKEAERWDTIAKITNIVVQFVQSNPEKFKYMSKYMKESVMELEKFFKVNVYCFLAQKLNFNLNEYFAQAFNNEEEEYVRKKVKLNESAE